MNRTESGIASPSLLVGGVGATVTQTAGGAPRIAAGAGAESGTPLDTSYVDSSASSSTSAATSALMSLACAEVRMLPVLPEGELLSAQAPRIRASVATRASRRGNGDGGATLRAS